MFRGSSLILILVLVLQFSCSKGRIVDLPVIDPGTGGSGSGPVGGSPVQIGKTVLSLGDSYTIGQSVSPNDRFPVQTKEWLQANSINILDPRIIAGSGWTTYVLQNQIGNQSVPNTYDAVTLLIGVNDQYIRRDTSEYRRGFTQLLQQAVFFANEKATHVFVLSIPDYSVTPFAANSDTARIRKEIDLYNAIARQVTLLHGANFLDITPSSREAKNDPSLLASDGLHPSGLEYKKWAARLGEMMKPVLQ